MHFYLSSIFLTSKWQSKHVTIGLFDANKGLRCWCYSQLKEIVNHRFSFTWKVFFVI
jgi:hypothetical protein